MVTVSTRVTSTLRSAPPSWPLRLSLTCPSKKPLRDLWPSRRVRGSLPSVSRSQNTSAPKQVSRGPRVRCSVDCGDVRPHKMSPSPTALRPDDSVAAHDQRRRGQAGQRQSARWMACSLAMFTCCLTSCSVYPVRRREVKMLILAPGPQKNGLRHVLRFTGTEAVGDSHHERRNLLNRHAQSGPPRDMKGRGGLFARVNGGRHPNTK